MTNLKPCPYCGNTGPMLYHYLDGYIVHCGRYHCDGKFAYRAPTEEGCIKAWNENAERIGEQYGNN